MYVCMFLSQGATKFAMVLPSIERNVLAIDAMAKKCEHVLSHLCTVPERVYLAATVGDLCQHTRSIMVTHSAFCDCYLVLFECTWIICCILDLYFIFREHLSVVCAYVIANRTPEIN